MNSTVRTPLLRESRDVEVGIDDEEESQEETRSKWEKSYFHVMGLCCSSEVRLVEKILRPLQGVKDVSVIVPSKTVIVVHDNLLISRHQIVTALNQARLEASIRVEGQADFGKNWPRPYVIVCGSLLLLSLLKFVYQPFLWLAVAAVLVGVPPVILRCYAAIRNLTLDINILVLVAVAGTMVLRDYLEAGSIVFLFTIAQWLESRASHKATTVMSSLMSMEPQQAVVEETGEAVNVADVRLNTIVAVKAGEVIPIDGIVIEGTSEVDEKTLTGESFPVLKQRNSVVWAGTINLNGYMSVKTAALAGDTVVARMSKVVEAAQNRKSAAQRLIDRFAKYYMPAVILISLCVAAVPAVLRVQNRDHWYLLALVVLVSACPCGLILSTPVATFCSLSRAASVGLLIKGGDYLEQLAKIKVIAFDKTGTITTGDFALIDFQSLSSDVSTSTLLYWVSSVESKSSHPIAAAIVNYGRSQDIEPKPENVEEFQNFPGEGICGIVDGREIFIGSPKIAHRTGCLAAQVVEGGKYQEGKTLGYIYDKAALIGIFSLSDSCRSGAKDAINELKIMGIRTAMLTGDNRAAAICAQEQLGHALDEIHAELLPEDKARMIQDYKILGPTGMVGDGVNDAPALATADVGISMGISGSSLVMETGHVVLMSSDIRKIPEAIQLAKRSIRKVLENIIFTVVVKAAVLAVAIFGHPLVWLAVLADVLTCLIVIFNSMLLLEVSKEQRKSCLPLLFSSLPHDRKDCCSVGNDPSGISKLCCASKNAEGKKSCCSITKQVSDTSKACCSQMTALETCDLSPSIVHASENQTCGPGRCLSSGILGSCCSVKLAVGTHEHLRRDSAHSDVNTKCCSTNKPSPLTPMHQKTILETCDPDGSIVRANDNQIRCSDSGLSSGISRRCCSAKMAPGSCDTRGYGHTEEKSSCCSPGKPSFNTPGQCSLQKKALDTCDPSDSVVCRNDNQICCSGSSSSVISNLSAKMAVRNRNSSGVGDVQTDDKKQCCLTSKPTSDTPTKCCSKKMGLEIGDLGGIIVRANENKRCCSGISSSNTAKE